MTFEDFAIALRGAKTAGDLDAVMFKADLDDLVESWQNVLAKPPINHESFGKGLRTGIAMVLGSVQEVIDTRERIQGART